MDKYIKYNNCMYHESWKIMKMREKKTLKNIIFVFLGIFFDISHKRRLVITKKNLP